MRPELKRLKRLEAEERRANPLAHRILELSEDERYQFARWQAARRDWLAARPGGQAYADFLAGVEMPVLAISIREKVFGKREPLPASCTVDEARLSYEKVAQIVY